jgi:hypothetical protein
MPTTAHNGIPSAQPQSVSLSRLTPMQEHLWLKTPINQLFIYTGTEWRLIGPESVEGFASTKARSATINDVNDVARPVIFLETNGVALAICTSVAFTINSQ